MRNVSMPVIGHVLFLCSVSQAQRYLLIGAAACRGLLLPSAAGAPHEPLIAISAISHRLPAALQYCSGDQIRAVPLDRWDAEGLKAPGLGARFGGFVADWAHFDASLFAVSPPRLLCWTRSSACCWRWVSLL